MQMAANHNIIPSHIYILQIREQRLLSEIHICFTCTQLIKKQLARSYQSRTVMKPCDSSIIKQCQYFHLILSCYTDSTQNTGVQLLAWLLIHYQLKHNTQLQKLLNTIYLAIRYVETQNDTVECGQDEGWHCTINSEPTVLR